MKFWKEFINWQRSEGNHFGWQDIVECEERPPGCPFLLALEYCRSIIIIPSIISCLIFSRYCLFFFTILLWGSRGYVLFTQICPMPSKVAEIFWLFCVYLNKGTLLSSSISFTFIILYQLRTMTHNTGVQVMILTFSKHISLGNLLKISELQSTICAMTHLL